MIAIVHSICSQSVHAPALNAGLMDNDAERYCTHNRCPYLSPTPPPKNKSLAHQYTPTAAITLILYTIITTVLQIL